MFTSRNEGTINRRTNTQTNTIASLDLILELNLSKIWGAHIDNALLKAINDNAIQST